MKKWLSLAVFGCLFTISWGQVESAGPITINPTGIKKIIPIRAGNPIDSTIVYLADTLELGVAGLVDDFSSSKFQVFDAEPGDAGQTEELVYKLMTNGSPPVPVDSDAEYVGYQTFRKTVSGGVTTTENLPAQPIRVGDFAAYPVSYTLMNLYPRYDIIDSADVAGDIPDTVLVPAEYVQDSARIFTATLSDPRFIWMDHYVEHSYWSAVNPWTLGVATFDGLDETGFPYNFDSGTSGIADFLTSKPINLAYSPGDSVYLSFLVQRQGFLDAPEAIDSLTLEFYNTNLGTWQRVWGINGGPVGDFMVGHIKITQADYLTDAFRFRFKNRGALSGALDQFHLDYVKLRRGSGYQDTLFKDFALVYPISNLIKDYTQVPWDHWQNDPRMSDSVKVVVRNGSNIDENNQDGTADVAYNGTIVTPTPFILERNLLSAPDFNYEPRTVYTSYHDCTGGYEYAQPGLEEAEFDIIGWVGAQFSNPTFNDSSFYKQFLGDVYAYDDGSAEKAYGPVGVQARLAYKFTPYEEDSIIAVRMRFVPSVVDVSDNLFLLTVWGDNNGVPGTVLYEDTYLRTPIYNLEGDGFVDYFLEDTLRLPVGSTFYVGWRQVEQERLNIGLDMNNDNSDKIFFSVNGGASWSNSMFDASLLIRPVFSTTHNYDLSVEEAADATDWAIYPNPTTGLVAIRWDGVNAFPGAAITDAQGRVVARIETAGQFTDLRDAPAGMYFVQVNGLTGPVKKLIRY